MALRREPELYMSLDALRLLHTTFIKREDNNGYAKNERRKNKTPWQKEKASAQDSVTINGSNQPWSAKHSPNPPVF
jgi:hypothetical protein